MPAYGLLLIGPAGTGKSQIAYTVARILKMPWATLEMSSINDPEQLTGSSRIYANAKPGIIIGRQGAEIEKLRAEISKIAGGKDVNLNIVEVKNPDMNAKLVAENIAMQLEQRVSFRRAMKSCIGRTMKSGAKGIKTMVSGRLGGAEIARSESYHEGTIPLQTLRADIDYGVARANTTYGVIGVKVWIYKGEVLKGEIPAQRTAEKPRRRNNDNRSRRPRVEKKEGGNE